MTLVTPRVFLSPKIRETLRRLFRLETSQWRILRGHQREAGESPYVANPQDLRRLGTMSPLGDSAFRNARPRICTSNNTPIVGSFTAVVGTSWTLQKNGQNKPAPCTAPFTGDKGDISILFRFFLTMPKDETCLALAPPCLHKSTEWTTLLCHLIVHASQEDVKEQRYSV
jgi:hypothetical protein